MGRSEESIELLEKTTQFFSIFPVEYLMELGRAYRLTGQREKAVEMQRQIFTWNPGHGMAYLTHLELAILYSELGLEAEAKTEAAEILKLVPNFSVKVYGQRAPYRDPALPKRDVAALRKAGLR
jgi:tetratricopeptide (TPR) repeat protein